MNLLRVFSPEVHERWNIDDLVFFHRLVTSNLYKVDSEQISLAIDLL